MTDVQVKIELGHKAVPRTKPTKEGFTHDWQVYVRGPEQYNISNFVEKVVFNLHPSFENPKRVCKEPPYQVEESGYASFELPIDICFKSKAEPRNVSIRYNLLLNTQDPVNHSRCEKLTFQNPTEEFKKKLLKGGGWQMMPQEDKQFENLFGTPIKTTESPKKAKQSSSSMEKPSRLSLDDSNSRSSHGKSKDRESSSSKTTISGKDIDSHSKERSSKDRHSSKESSSSRKHIDSPIPQSSSSSSSSKRHSLSPGRHEQSKKLKRSSSSSAFTDKQKSKEREKERELEKGREREREKEREREREKEKEIERAKEREREKEIERAKEREREKEIERAKEREREKEIEQAKEREREKEIERAKEREREKEIERAKEKEREREKERKKEKERIQKERKERENAKMDKNIKKSEKYKTGEIEERKEISPVANIKKEKDKSPEDTKRKSDKVKRASDESRKSISPKDNTSKDEQKVKRKSSDSYRVKETVKVKTEKQSDSTSTKKSEHKSPEKKHSKMSEQSHKVVAQKHKQLSKITSRELIDDLSLSDDSDSSEVSSSSSSTATTVGRSRSGSPAMSDSESESETKGSPSPAPSSNVSPVSSPLTETPLGKLIANLPSEESDEEIQERDSKLFTKHTASRPSPRANTPRKKSSGDGRPQSQPRKTSMDTSVSEQNLPFNKYVKRSSERDLQNSDRSGEHLKHSDSSGFDMENVKKRRNDSSIKNGYEAPINSMESPNGEDLTELVALQKKLMKITDPHVLMKVVLLIKKVGKFKIVDSSFDFDLCALDSPTVQKIQAYLSQC